MILAPLARVPLTALASADAPPPAGEALTLPLLFIAGRSGAPRLGLSLLATGSAEHAGIWDVRVKLGDADVSAWVTGTIRTEAEEGAARIAELQLLPGGPYSLASVSGRAVQIDMQCQPGGAWHRRFTGVVELPELEVGSKLLTLHATDARNDTLATKTRPQLATLLGGSWSDTVFSADADSLRYAEDRLSTVQASYDLDVYRQPRLTAWRATPPTLRFDAGIILDGSLRLQTNRLSELVNTVVSSFEFRYPRLIEQQHTFTWSNDQPLREFFANKFRFPEKTTVESAAGGVSGWGMLSARFDPAPPSQTWQENGVVYNWKNPFTDQPDADPYCSRAQVAMAWRGAQDVMEKWTVTVTAPDSVAVHGVRKQDGQHGQLAVETDTSAWENRQGLAAGDLDQLTGQGRAEANAGIRTLQAVAAAQIAASHRNTRLTFQMPAHSTLDVCHSIAVEHPHASGCGKVQRIVETLDTGSGQATVEVTMVLSTTLVVGTVPATPLPAPPTPPKPPPPAATSAGGITVLDKSSMATLQHDGFLGFSDEPSTDGAQRPSEFRISAPEVPAALRDPVEVAQKLEHKLALPADPLILNP